MMQKEPYFMKNEAWYYFDKEEWKYKLKEEAPEEARKSYEEFYKPNEEEGKTIDD